MTRRYGRARRGRRVCAKIPYGRWRTTTFIAGLRHDEIIAPFVLDGPIDGTSFLDYVVKVLVPDLKPGDVVVLDNLSSHKSEAIKAAIEAAGAALMFLPPYSPDLNPIELMFSKLKTLLRKAAERTVDALWNRIGELLDHFTPQECANFLRHAGYNQTRPENELGITSMFRSLAPAMRIESGRLTRPGLFVWKRYCLAESMA